MKEPAMKTSEHGHGKTKAHMDPPRGKGDLSAGKAHLMEHHEMPKVDLDRTNLPHARGSKE